MKCPRRCASKRRGTLRGREDNDFLPEEESVPKLLTNHLLKKTMGFCCRPRASACHFVKTFLLMPRLQDPGGQLSGMDVAFRQSRRFKAMAALTAGPCV